MTILRFKTSCARLALLRYLYTIYIIYIMILAERGEERVRQTLSADIFFTRAPLTPGCAEIATVCTPVPLSIRLSTCLYVSPFVCKSVRLPIRRLICGPPDCTFVCLYVDPSVCPSVYT